MNLKNVNLLLQSFYMYPASDYLPLPLLPSLYVGNHLLVCTLGDREIISRPDTPTMHTDYTIDKIRGCITECVCIMNCDQGKDAIKSGLPTP